jgi:hypothetical protein
LLRLDPVPFVSSVIYIDFRLTDPRDFRLTGTFVAPTCVSRTFTSSRNGKLSLQLHGGFQIIKIPNSVIARYASSGIAYSVLEISKGNEPRDVLKGQYMLAG